ncbi:RHS repeat-associated core domain-containing protein, partial [Pseudomonas sichuanensis]
RLHKHSVAHFWDRPEAGTGWNQLQRAKRQRELGCGFTLFGWDGDTLAWESSPPLDEGDTGRTVHYLYEPDSFVPVAQALRKSPIRLHKVPDWSQREYDFEQDPLWHTEVKPQAFEAIAWYHCDHLGTPMELIDEQGNIAWAGQYKAWGEVRGERSEWARQHGLRNPIRFQGQYHDHETGLHYNRYRYYDPGTGRFVNQDPISYSGGINLFEYSRNPIEWVDPLGLAGNRANRRAGVILQNMDASGGGHAYSRHGAQTTLAQQERRAKTGVPPDCPCIKKPRPVNSTRFLSNVDQLDAIQRGKAAMNARGENIAEIEMNRNIGEGYKAGAGDLQTTSKAVIVRRNNNIVTAYPNL